MNIQLKARKQKGFTIIELVVVILLLGILAATALPRFLDVTEQAHEAVVDAVAGGLSTGSALFRAQWIANGQPTGAVSNFGEENLVARDVSTYVTGSIAHTRGYTSGQSSTLVANTTCQQVYNGLLQSGRPFLGRDASSNDAAYHATATTMASNIDAIAALAANANASFVAALVAESTLEESTTCNFYYIGEQRRAAPSATLDADATIPVIQYNFATGEVTIGSFIYK